MDSTRSKKLIEISARMRESLKVFEEINQKSAIIALNAAIEGARLRGSLGSFSIVARQIHNQSNRNTDLSGKLNKLVDRLQSVSLRSTAVRYYEMAEDLIDKLDRNLFERNCDVQAWATFEEIVECAGAGKELESHAVVEAIAQNPSFSQASDLLRRLMTTYVVYADIFLVSEGGVVIAAAKNGGALGQDFSREDWFQAALNGQVDVSEMRYCQWVNNHSVFYSAPVRDATNKVIGVLSTRFNWDFAQEMIDHAGYESDVRACILNSQGTVLANSVKLGIMKDAMDWLDAGLSTTKGECGYSIEKARNGRSIAVGFARTKGYNSYRGKKWSSLLSCNFEDHVNEHIHQPLDLRTEEKPLGQAKQPGDTHIASEKANFELQKTMGEINQLVQEVNKNNKEAKLLAINASIQAGIAGTDGEGFGIIAEEIGQLALKSLGFVELVNSTAQDLQIAVSATVSNRLTDAARDTIDKVDRNLFERFCDVQAWTVFRSIVQALETKSNFEQIHELLAKLHKIYEIYHDILLLDAQGNIVSTAINRRLLGENQSGRAWFQQALGGKVNFTDVYQSNSTQTTTVAFSAPVLSASGQVLGVLTTRFNCNFLNDILRAAIIDSKSEIFLINKAGTVVATSDGNEVLQKSLAKYDAASIVGEKKFGHLVEKDPTGDTTFSIGYAGTVGYNTYPGNGWSILIRRQVEPSTVSSSEEPKAAPTQLKAA